MEVVIEELGGVNLSMFLPVRNVLVLLDHLIIHVLKDPVGYCTYTSRHLSFGAKRVEVEVLPPHEDLADPLEVAPDLLF